MLLNKAALPRVIPLQSMRMKVFLIGLFLSLLGVVFADYMQLDAAQTKPQND